MNQYRRPPYAAPAPPRPARWPWALLIVVLAAVGAIGALIISGSALPGTDPTQETVAGPNGEMIIVSQADATSTVPPSPVESAAPAESVPATTDSAAADGQASGELPIASASAAPAPTATPAGPTNAEVAADWAAKWQAGDFSAMYDMLSDDTRAGVSEEDFASRYQAIYERATISEVAIAQGAEPVDATATAVPFTATFTSSVLGEISLDNSLPLVREDSQWRVAWTPSAIIADLGDGCVDVPRNPTERGMILDRNGQVLAQDEVLYTIGVQAGAIEDEAALNEGLARLLHMTPEEVAAAYANADPAQFTPIRSLPKREGDPILNDLNAFPGVIAQQSSFGRYYPYGSVAAHVTGYVTAVTEEDIAADPTLVSGTQVGRTGLEYGANPELAGTAGASLDIVDCSSRAVRSEIMSTPPIPGKDLILTIDIALQQRVDQTLSAVEGDDERGSAVIIDPRNGAVLAMVSHPTYDPNGFTLGMSSADMARVNDEELTPLHDRAAETGYPVGSIFKVITMAAGMAHLGYDQNTVLDCPSSFELNGNIYNDWVIEWGQQPQGQLTLHDALVQSCNTVFYGIGAELDQRDDLFLPNMARAFGLGAPTDIPYFPEVAGVVPDPAWKLAERNDGWATGDAVNLAIGQGFLLATPLQMANVYATIANGGTLLQPYIVEFTQVPGGPATRVGERVERGTVPISAEQMEEIQLALRDQTSNANQRGSARVFGPDYPFAIAGKTGTSEDGGTRGEQPHSWFAAFGPWDAAGAVPTIASVVMIENIGEGGKFAAPATKTIYDYYQTTDLADVTDAGAGPPQAQEPILPSPTPSTRPSGSPRPSSSGRRRRNVARMRSRVWRRG